MFCVVPSFITLAEADKFLLLANSANEGSWNNPDDGPWCGKKLTLDTSVFAPILDRLASYFTSYSRINQLSSIQRFCDGQEMGIHTDNVGGDDISFGCIIYLNDDFNGGELYYPEHGIRIKPQARTLVVHSSDERHCVLPVSGNTRYMMTTFVFSGQTNSARFVYVNS